MAPVASRLLRRRARCVADARERGRTGVLARLVFVVLWVATAARAEEAAELARRPVPAGHHELEGAELPLFGPVPGGDAGATAEMGWLSDSWFSPQRHRGLGQPLQRTSWRNRPVSLGGFVGGLATDDPIDGELAQSDTILGGVRLGYDWTHFWGSELRFGFFEADLLSPDAGVLETSGDAWMLDVHVLYYPWGDARWRPFVSLGGGFVSLDYRHADGQPLDETAFQLPFGGGVKYLFDRSLALRIDVLDNFSVGSSQTSSMHNISYSLGFEWRFGGGTSKRYYPY